MTAALTSSVQVGGSTPSARGRATRRPALLVWMLAAALILSGALVGPSDAKPRPPKSSGRAAAALPVDNSGAMPAAARGEVTYDFLNRGYEQRLVAENGMLQLYDAPAYGGEPLGDGTALDLAPPPQSVGTEQSSQQMYDYFSNEGDWSCGGCLSARASAHGYNAIYLVVLDGFLYISGTKNTTLGVTGYPDYENLIYKAPLDLSCASSSCLPAANVKALTNDYAGDQGSRIVGTTALAGGFSAGVPYLAVGLTDTGLLILDADLNQTAIYQGMSTPQTAQTPVISAAWDPAGTGILALGVMSYGNEAFLLNINRSGAIANSKLVDFVGFDQLWNSPMSVAFGHRANGSLLVAFGSSGGVDGSRPAGLYLWDGANGGQALTSLSVPGNGVVTVEAIPRIDGTTGGDDFAVYSDSGSGSLLRYNESSNSLAAMPLQSPAPPNGSTTQLATDAWRSWFPGYKTGQITLENTGVEDVDVTLQVSSATGSGCWFGPAFSTSSAWPGGTVLVKAGQSSGTYTFGGLTAGIDGGCGSGDETAAWRAYLVVTPVNRPADARIVNLQLQPTGLTIDTTDQVGGSTTVSAARDAKGAAVGHWTVTIGGPAAPTPQAAPTIQNARQITTNVRGRASVYRVDVGPTAWTVPGAAANASQPQVQVVLPPLQVQGSSDGQTWTSLGALMPVGPVTRSGTTVTLSGASFWWENPTGSPAYGRLRVLSGGLPSAPVVLSSLLTPTAPSTPIQSLQLTATKTTSSVANVVPGGVDQAQIQVVITDTNGNIVPATSAAYDSVYYRDSGNNLITNLYQAGEDFTGAQPNAGAYPNNVGGPQRGRPVGGGVAYDYLTTTNYAQTPITGKVGLGAPTTGNAAKMLVNAEAVRIEGIGDATSGFSLNGCTDFSSGGSCIIASAGSQPALYQAGTDDTYPLVGVQLVNLGQNSADALPMPWAAGQSWSLVRANLQVSNQSSLVKVGNLNAFPPDSQGGRLDIFLVSHGQALASSVSVE